MSEKHAFTAWMLRWHRLLPLEALDFAQDNAELFDSAPEQAAQMATARKVATAAREVQEHTFVQCMHRGLYGDRPETCVRCQAMRHLADALAEWDAVTAPAGDGGAQ